MLLLVSHLRLSQREDNSAGGWLNLFDVITLYQQLFSLHLPTSRHLYTRKWIKCCIEWWEYHKHNPHLQAGLPVFFVGVPDNCDRIKKRPRLFNFVFQITVNKLRRDPDYAICFSDNCDWIEKRPWLCNLLQQLESTGYPWHHSIRDACLLQL